MFEDKERETNGQHFAKVKSCNYEVKVIENYERKRMPVFIKGLDFYHEACFC